jgi:hypothetical protein
MNILGILTQPSALPATVSGGTLYTSGGFNYRVFTANGDLVVTGGTLTADLLVIAGGGSGLSRYGGGGGAGGICYKSSSSLSAATYTITIGAGGARVAVFGVPGNQGVDSSISGSGISTITAKGGGYGGYASNDTDGIANQGGSGGGGGGFFALNITGAASNQTGSGGSTGYGNAGGNGITNYAVGGGGGGAGAVGGNGSTSGGGGDVGGTSGSGGAGLDIWSSWASATSTGVSGYFAGGGGAGFQSNSNREGGGRRRSGKRRRYVPQNLYLDRMPVLKE